MYFMVKLKIHTKNWIKLYQKIHMESQNLKVKIILKNILKKYLIIRVSWLFLVMVKIISYLK